MQKIKHKKVKGRMKVLKATLYKGHMIYIRQIGKDYFEYLTEYNGEIYSSYIIITPREGKKRLSKTDINGCIEIVHSGAEATIDALLGAKVAEEDKKKVELFEETRKVMEDGKK
jgi:hypothetical protein